MSPGGSDLPRRLRAWAGRVRRAPERWLHPWRRRRAAARVRRAAVSGSRPLRILVVCSGNINRSPYAAGALGRDLPPRLRDEVRVESAGLFGPGRPSPPLAREVAASRGVDLAAHRSAPATPHGVAASDLVLVMEPWQSGAVRDAAPDCRGVAFAVLGDLDPEPIRARRIRDPVEAPREVFEGSFARIDRCLQALVRVLEEVW